MSVRIENTRIELNIPIQGGKVPEYYVVEKGKPIDPTLFGIPYRDPGALPGVIAQLRAQSLGLDNGKRKFAGCIADNLSAAIIAIRNSQEF